MISINEIDKQGLQEYTKYMNKAQRQNTSKLLYEIIKLTFGGVIVSVFLPGKFSLFNLINGFWICLVAYAIAYYLDSKEDTHE